MGIIVDKIGDKAVSLMSEYILKLVKESKCNDLWKKAVKKACEATEGIDDSIADDIIESLAIQRFFIRLINDKPLDDLYRSFILTVAVELSEFNAEKRFAVSLGMAILDNWFELNGNDYQNIKKYPDIKNQIVGDKIVKVVNDREKLYRAYFLLYNDPLAKDIIRVYYPKNDESWISWDKNYSVDVKVNLSKGTEYGFCRVGFSYSRIEEQSRETFLKVAYINEDREIYRFEHEDMLGIDAEKLLWVW
jgi:hypothetical protein